MCVLYVCGCSKSSGLGSTCVPCVCVCVCVSMVLAYGANNYSLQIKHRIMKMGASLAGRFLTMKVYVYKTSYHVGSLISFTIRPLRLFACIW